MVNSNNISHLFRQHVRSQAQTVIITNCPQNLPYFGHRDRMGSPGVSQLVTQVGEAGDVEVTGLDIQGVQTDIQLTGNLPQWSTLKSLEMACVVMA